jgi:hypothetical protein
MRNKDHAVVSMSMRREPGLGRAPELGYSACPCFHVIRKLGPEGLVQGCGGGSVEEGGHLAQRKGLGGRRTETKMDGDVRPGGKGKE